MDKPKIRFYLGIFFVSSATLCLEIMLTRYFSIAQQYHFAFFVVSIAFLGYGASGSFLSLFKKIHGKDRDIILSNTSLFFAISVFISFILVNAIPFDSFKLAWETHQIFYIFLYYLLLSLPFFFAGLTISFAISKTPLIVNKIYFYDLAGAGCGTLFAVVIFLPKGDRGVILIIFLLALLGSILFSRQRHITFKCVLAILSVAGIILFWTSPSWLDFRMSSFKGLPLALQYPKSKIMFTKWNGISRIDVLQSPVTRFAPGLSLTYVKELPEQIGLSVDGDELTAVTRLRSQDDSALEFLSYLPSFLPYRFVSNPHVLLIEPKGSVDVLTAHSQQASRIKIIENNPLIEKILRRELASYSGNLYNTSTLSVISSNSRTSIKKEMAFYDLIVLPLTDILGSTGTGLYGFGEKYLFTVESFESILERLSPEGIISMTLFLLPPPRQELRALSTWITALERKGKNPKNHLLSLRSWGTISYFIKNSPITRPEILEMKDFAEEMLFDLVYYPGIKQEEANTHNKFKNPIYYDYCRKLLSSEDRTNFYKDYLFQVKPVSDDRPFFNNFFKAGRLGRTYESFGRKWLPFLQGEFLIPIILFQALIAAMIMIFVPLFILKSDGARKGKIRCKVLVYFSLIGMGFMFIEITFIQKFILFLGHPLYSISLVIFSLLISSGLGSLLSKRLLRAKVIPRMKWAIVLCSCLTFSSLAVFPVLYKNAVGLPLVLKGILTLLFIFPLGFTMGFPFPTGIRLLETRAKHLIPWAWATNAFSSVISSVSALMIAFLGGYTFVLLMAGCCYLLTIPFLSLDSAQNT